MNYPYFNLLTKISPAVCSSAIPLLSEIIASGVYDEFAVLATAWRRTNDPALRDEIKGLLYKEIQHPGSVIPL